MTPATAASTGGNGFPPAQGRPAMSDTPPPADTQASFGDDAAGAVGSAAPLVSDTSAEDDDHESASADPER
jgi:hypothetical protein